jgi:tRNA A37 threonylcarbamoyltransferase TsaD
MKYCTDNAAMIGMAATINAEAGRTGQNDHNILPNLNL